MLLLNLFTVIGGITKSSLTDFCVYVYGVIKLSYFDIQAVKDSLLAVSGVTVNPTVIGFLSAATCPASSRVQSSNVEELSRAVYIRCVNPTLRSKTEKD